MPHRLSRSILLAALAAFAAAPESAADDDAAAPEAAASKALRVGGAAPQFTLTDLDGKQATLSEHLARGPVLLDFWALWCKPCLKSLPSTQAIHDRFRERGLSVLAVNTDSPRSAAKVKSYVRSNGFTFGVPLDPNGTMQRLYRFYRIPQIFLIAPDGTVAFEKLGYSPGTEELLVAEIEKLLGPAKD
jgi:peroxiredoxin